MKQRLAATLMFAVLLLSACSGPSSDASSPYLDGREVYGNVCSACHGPAGQGGVGPEMGSVLETFPSCTDQVRWIRLGSQRWITEVGPTYGATHKPVEGAMPSMAAQLSEDEILSVAVYERSRFGGVEETRAEEQCGITAQP